MYYLYMIKNSFNQLYVGVSENPRKRLYYHNHGRGANFTKDTNDFSIVFLEAHQDLISVRKREIQIKKWRREKKEMLIDRYNHKLPT